MSNLSLFDSRNLVLFTNGLETARNFRVYLVVLKDFDPYELVQQYQNDQEFQNIYNQYASKQFIDLGNIAEIRVNRVIDPLLNEEAYQFISTTDKGVEIRSLDMLFNLTRGFDIVNLDEVLAREGYQLDGYDVVNTLVVSTTHGLATSSLYFSSRAEITRIRCVSPDTNCRLLQLASLKQDNQYTDLQNREVNMLAVALRNQYRLNSLSVKFRLFSQTLVASIIGQTRLRNSLQVGIPKAIRYIQRLDTKIIDSYPVALYDSPTIQELKQLNLQSRAEHTNITYTISFYNPETNGYEIIEVQAIPTFESV